MFGMFGKPEPEPDSKPEPSNTGDDIQAFFDSLSNVSSAEAMVSTATKLLTNALEMTNEGPEAETPIAKLFADSGALQAVMLGVLMSPDLSSKEKLPLLAGVVVAAMREYEVTLA